MAGLPPDLLLALSKKVYQHPCSISLVKELLNHLIEDIVTFINAEDI